MLCCIATGPGGPLHVTTIFSCFCWKLWLQHSGPTHLGSCSVRSVWTWNTVWLNGHANVNAQYITAICGDWKERCRVMLHGPHLAAGERGYQCSAMLPVLDCRRYLLRAPTSGRSEWRFRNMTPVESMVESCDPCVHHVAWM
eukprot:jgi/Ulvmu1/1465/UM011_0195.1